MDRLPQHTFETSSSGFRHLFPYPPYTSHKVAAQHSRSFSFPVTEDEIHQYFIKQNRLSDPVLSASTMSTPIAPGPDEISHYYYGLPSRPRLVARTNFADKWKNIKGVEFAPAKVLRNVGRHPIAVLWNDSTGPLRRSIIEALIGIDWSAIDILSIGSETDEPKKCPVVLFISVRPDSTSFATCYAIASRCLKILRSHSIHDVHVEIKESDVQRSYSIPQQAPIDSPKLSSGPFRVYSHAGALWSEFLGVSVANSTTPYCNGTKCLYLRQRNTNNVLALTCRHVVLPLLGPEYRFDDRDRNSQSELIIRPGDRALEYQKSLIAGQLENVGDLVEMADSSLTLSLNEKQRRKHILRSSLPGWKEVERHLEALSEPATRIIGHLLYSPSHASSEANSGNPRLRDWALIQVHQNKHSTRLTALQNQVRVGPTHDLTHKLFSAAMAEKINCHSWLPLNPGREPASLLRQTIPETEMFRPTEETGSLDAPAIVVVLYGATSGLCIGLANEVKSITRKPVDGYWYESEGWCLIGQRLTFDCRRDHFSRNGDSGSCIFDDRGRIGGMVTGGLSEGHDVT